MGKKKKDVDFQKIKLKVGKKLKKNTNVTDTSFKAKKILIRKKEKPEVAEPTTHRKLTVKELLNRLKHSNPSVRHDAITGLRELFSGNPEIVLSSLSVLIEKITEVILDEDHVIRRAAIKTLETLFKFVSVEQIMPFFAILKSYLGCAITHIINDIHNDSLLFLDLLLNYFPHLTITSCSHIVENLIEHSIKKGPKALTRKKLDLLTRLESFLQATLNIQEVDKCKNETPVVRQNGSNTLYVTVYKNGERTPNIVNNFYLHQNFSPLSINDSIVNNPISAINFLNAASSLLIDILSECKSSSLQHISGKQKQDGITLEVMQSVMNNIILLEACAKVCDLSDGSDKIMETFTATFQSSVLLKLMSFFPFELVAVTHNVKKGSCVLFNMSVSNVFTVVFSTMTSEVKKYYTKIVNYINTVLACGEVGGKELTLQTLKVIEKLSNYNMDTAISENLLCSLYNVYKQWQIGRKDREAVMKYFMDLALQPNYSHLVNTSVFKTWLKLLPKELVIYSHEYPSSVPSFLRNASILALRGFPVYLEGLQEYSHEILEILPILCQKFPDDSDLHNHIVELITFIPTFSREIFLSLPTILMNISIPAKTILHLVTVLQTRYSRKDSKFDVGSFISFLLGIALGVLKKDTEVLCKKYTNDEKWYELRELLPSSMMTFTILPSDKAIWNRHMSIVEKVTSIIAEFNYLSNFQDLVLSIHNYTQTILTQFSSLPTHTAVSILILQSKLFLLFPTTEKYQYLLADLSLSLLLHSVTFINVVPGHESEIEQLLKIVCQFLRVTNLADKLCNIIWNRVKVSSVQQVAILGSTFLLLLKSEVFTGQEVVILDNILCDLQLQFPFIVEKIWWKELSYFMSLYKGMPSVSSTELYNIEVAN